MMTDEEWAEMLELWEAPGSLYAPEAQDDADAMDGIAPLPGMSVEVLRHPLGVA